MKFRLQILWIWTDSIAVFTKISWIFVVSTSKIIKFFTGDDLFQAKLSKPCVWELILQVNYELRNWKSTWKPPAYLLRFWGYKKKPRSAKSLKLIKIMWKIIPDHVLAKKSGATYFFSHVKIFKFSLKTCWFLRIRTSNEYKLILRPILHPQAPTWPTVTYDSPFLGMQQPKTFFRGNSWDFYLTSLFSQ